MHDGLVLFNRFYEPDIDIEHLEIQNSLDLSSQSDIRLPMMWLGILHGQVATSLAATSGVYTGVELIKYLLAGADVAMTTSALLKHGIEHIRAMLDELELWMETRSMRTLEEMRGLMSQQKINDPSSYGRANYIRILKGYQA